MTTEQRPTKNRADYTVGWICALYIEQAAAAAMLDEWHSSLPNPPHDSNTYTLGSIGMHNIVIVCLPQGRYGTNAAANVVTLLAGTYPAIRSCLMVGVGGGIPSNAVRLGDVVVGTPEGQYPGVVQGDMGKITQGGKFGRTGALDNPPKALLTAVSSLRMEHELKGSNTQAYLDELKTKYPLMAGKYLKSNSLVDVLFKASSSHITSLQRVGDAGRDCDQEEAEDEEEVHEESEEDECKFCDKTKVIKRQPRDVSSHPMRVSLPNTI
jgi:hypothetical protein